MSALLLGQQRTVDVVAGYPAHRVEVWWEWTNPHGCTFTDWRASCGHIDTASGSAAVWAAHRRGGWHSTLPAERCRDCWYPPATAVRDERRAA